MKSLFLGALLTIGSLSASFANNFSFSNTASNKNFESAARFESMHATNPNFDLSTYATNSIINNKYSNIYHGVNSFVDSNLTLSANAYIQNCTISIVGAIEMGDSLSVVGELPVGFSTYFDVEKHALTIQGSANSEQWQALLRNVQIYTASATATNKVIDYSFSNANNTIASANVLFSDNQKSLYESMPLNNDFSTTVENFKKVVSVQEEGVANFGTFAISISKICSTTSTTGSIASPISAVDANNSTVTYNNLIANGAMSYNLDNSQTFINLPVATSTINIGSNSDLIFQYSSASNYGRFSAKNGKSLNQIVYLKYTPNSINAYSLPTTPIYFQLVVRTIPTISVTAASAICTGSSTNLNVALTGTGPWSLNYSDGSNTNTINNIQSSPYAISVSPITSPTTYNFSQVTDNIGCTTTETLGVAASKSISITTRPTATLSGTNTICDGSASQLTFNLTGTQPFSLTYKDNLNNSTTVTGITSTTYTVNVNPSASRTYTIVSLSDAQCSSLASDLSGSAVVTVNPRPTGVISGTATICNGTSSVLSFVLTGTAPYSLTYNDSQNGSTTITGIQSSTYTISVAPRSNTTYTLVSLSDANCTANNADKTGSAVIAVQNALTIAPIADAYFCTGGNVVLTANVTGVVTSYQWYNGSTAIGGATSSTYSAVTPGTYSVTATNVCGTISSNSIVVAEKARPVASITITPNSKLPNESAVVSVSLTSTLSDWGFTYTTGLTPISVTGIQAATYTFTVNPTSSKTYSLTQIQDAFCSNTAPNVGAQLQVVSLPTATISGSTDFCSLPSSATLIVSLTGLPPYDLTYNTTVNGTSTPTTISGIQSSTYTFSVSPNKTTSYSVIALHDNNNLDAINSGLIGNATVTIPVLNLSYSNTSFCQGANSLVSPIISGNTITNILYTAVGQFGGYLIIDQNTGEIDIDASDPDVYTITLSGNYNACSISASTTININLPPQSNLSTNNGTICLGGNTLMTATLTGAAPFSITYSATDLQNNIISTTITGINSSTYTFTVNPIKTSIYRITNLVDGYCSSNAATVDLYGKLILTGTPQILVNPRPTSVLTGTPTTCNGTATNISLALTGKSPWTITYTGSDRSSTTTTISSNNSTIYTTGSPFLKNISVNPSTTIRLLHCRMIYVLQ